MRNAVIMLGLCLAVAAGPAEAQEESAPAREAHYAPFEVTQSPPPRARAIASFGLGGESVSLRAYGREARARRLGAVREMEEAREMNKVFEDGPAPALVTVEASISF